MASTFDLRRLDFRSDGVTVDTFDSRDLHVSTDRWVFYARSVSLEHLQRSLGAFRAIVRSTSGGREDILGGAGDEPIIYRFLRGFDKDGNVCEVDYDIIIGDYRIAAAAFRQSGNGNVLPREIDDLVLSFRLLAEPRLEAEVPPAWKAYQATRKLSEPLAKFVLSNDAPIRFGDPQRLRNDWTSLSHDDLQRGGRQIASDLLEFCVKSNAIEVRIDVWLDKDPAVKHGGEQLFRGTLQVHGPQLDICSFDDPMHLSVPIGDYDVDVALINGEQHDKEGLKEWQRFERDDLEHCEIILTRRTEMATDASESNTV